MSVLLLGLLLVTSGLAHGQPLTNQLARNCKEVQRMGGTKTAVYTIQTNSGTHNVLCDQQTNGGGWTVVQQRFDGAIRFWNRNWNEYRNGFGTPGLMESFYAGNELIHELTNQFDDNSTLRIEIYGDRNPGSQHANDFYFSEYYFRLNDEKSEYEAAIFIDWQHLVGNASTGWYDITYSNGVKFSTIDHNNDPDPDCQQIFHLGGWWTHYCGLISLNGEYTPRKFGDGYGLFFTVAGQFVVNPKTTRMMVRDRETK
ncbi:hypothetical protein M3Y98_00672900 [Aphelenchoides besseyi]|nr:hypothetical protein M3Y98_00672900 [Aphelenchoides besseyi]